MHEGRKGNKEETRNISASINNSDISQKSKQPHYWCCCALVSSLFECFFDVSLELQCDLIFRGPVVFRDPKT